MKGSSVLNRTQQSAFWSPRQHVWVTGKQLLGYSSHSLKRPHSSTCYWGVCLAAGCSGLLKWSPVSWRDGNGGCDRGMEMGQGVSVWWDN